VSAWWFTRVISGGTGPAGYAVLLLPVLLLLRSFAVATIVPSIMTGVVIALCFVGIVGLGVILVPFGAASIVLEARDLRERPIPRTWSVAVTSAVFVLTFVTLIVLSSSYYQNR